MARKNFVVIDEAQGVITWGNSFRPEFENLSELRSIFPRAKFLAMTATVSPKMRQDILSKLSMPRAKVISWSMDRENIKIKCYKRLPDSGGDNTPENSFFMSLNQLYNNLHGSLAT